ncbi:MAG: hypothetical protein LC107_01010 [Chitinophagales bacterium]|nr:hypothetical protein [Chitinophagales bacterium]
MNTIRFYLVLTILIMMSCHRDDSDISTDVDIIIEDTEQSFDSHFIGIVRDADGRSLSGVTVKAGDDVVQTSDNGIFIMKNIRTSSTATWIRLSKHGFFDKDVFISKSSGQFSNISVELERKEDFIEFSSDTDRQITVSDKMTLIIPAHNFKNMDGTLYNGTIHLYTSHHALMGQAPVQTLNFSKSIFQDFRSVSLSFETPTGSALQIIEPIQVMSDFESSNVALLDAAKKKWIEIKTSDNRFTLAQNTPMLFGNAVKTTRLKTRLVNGQGMGVSLVDIELEDETGTIYTVQADQNGYVETFVPAGSKLILKLKSQCGQLLKTEVLTTDYTEAINMKDITIDEALLTTIQTDAPACSDQLNYNDLVNIYLSSKNKDFALYQYESNQTFVIPTCEDIQQAIFYKANESAFSISFGGYQNQQLIQLDVTPLCINKLVGYYKIGNVVKYFDSDQFSIYFEKSIPDNLVISDLSNFVVSIPDVKGTGSYKVDAILILDPVTITCFDEECVDIKVVVSALNQLGDPVKIRFHGFISGTEISGEFENLLLQ